VIDCDTGTDAAAIALVGTTRDRFSSNRELVFDQNGNQPHNRPDRVKKAGAESPAFPTRIYWPGNGKSARAPLLL
jgi:hypothetical protein